MISGDAEQGNHIADSMLAHGRTLGWPTGLAMALYANGFTNQERAPDVALQACYESIVLTEQGASDVVYGHCHIVCGAVHRNSGDVASAAAEFSDAITYSLDIGDLIEVGSALSFVVPMIVRAGEPDAGIILGAGMVDGPFSMLILNAGAPTLQAEFDAALDAARRQLGEARYEQAQSRGAAMTMDELVAIALHTLRALR